MEYSGTVGTMVLDDLADVNKQLSGQVEVIMDRAQEVLANRINLDGQLEEEEEKEKETLLEAYVEALESEQHVFRWSLASLHVELIQNCSLFEDLSQEFHWFQAVLQHSPGNPIVVKDNDKVILEYKEEDTCGGHHLPPDRQLVLIEEEDPHRVTLEVERAMEREELWQQMYTMGDWAWWDAMKTYQWQGTIWFQVMRGLHHILRMPMIR